MSENRRDIRTCYGKRSKGSRLSFDVHISRAEEAFRESAKADMSPVEFQNFLANYYMRKSAESAAKLCKVQHREPNLERFKSLAEAELAKYVWKGGKILRYVLKWMDTKSTWEEMK